MSELEVIADSCQEDESRHVIQKGEVSEKEKALVKVACKGDGRMRRECYLSVLSATEHSLIAALRTSLID